MQNRQVDIDRLREIAETTIDDRLETLSAAERQGVIVVPHTALKKGQLVLLVSQETYSLFKAIQPPSERER